MFIFKFLSRKNNDCVAQLVECRSTVPKVVGSSPIAVIFPYSIVGKIPACHAGVPGSIPGEGASFLLFFFLLHVL